MAVKVKRRKSINRLQEDVDRKRLELELNLLESSVLSLDDYDLVDPREPFYDNDERWVPIGSTHDDKIVEPFVNPAELRSIRLNAKRLAKDNPYAKNLLNSICSFVVGTGHKYSAVPRKDIDDPVRAKTISKTVQRWLDRLLKINKWKKRQRNNCERGHRDGEVFIRLFYQESGMTFFRYVEPGDVQEFGDWMTKDEASFGIVTDKDDAETVEKYLVAEEEVDAEEIQHRKFNVDINSKRGLSSLYVVRRHLERSNKLLRNMSTTVQNQAAIAMIRHHNASKQAVQNFASNTATITRENLATGETDKNKRIRPGTVLDVREGTTKYEFPSAGLDPSKPIDVLQAELRGVASSKSLPEYMVGSDASNANYASTQVAENPGVQYLKTEQTDMIDDDLELIDAAMEWAIQVGRLPSDAAELVEIVVEPPQLVTRKPKEQADTDETYLNARVKSPQTIAAEQSLDYEQEQQNFRDHDDRDLDGRTISGGDSVISATPDDEEVELLGRVGGITGIMDILEKMNQRIISPETAKAVIILFFKLDADEASAIVDKSVDLPTVETPSNNGAGTPRF